MGVGMKGMTLLNSCLSAKELGLCLEILNFCGKTTQFCRALALQALVDRLYQELMWILSESPNFIKLG